ncbi:MAG TPA: thiamine pyrophosphate-dependent enzyme [Streptosporangiaceae bacterium]|jgi:2-oxoisovalerate dehydrogenase E1 component
MTEQDELERAFTDAVMAMRPGRETLVAGGRSLPGTAIRPGSALSQALCLELFEAQLGSRHLDLAARWLRERGAGFYTIGSAGHEGNAAVAAALRVTDPALLHYRSGAFYLTRACQAAGQASERADRMERGLRSVLLGLVAAAAEPISGGRHKVFGSAELAIIPQTSTIASHLPRAVGLAFALDRAGRLGHGRPCDQPRCLPHCHAPGGGGEGWRGWRLPHWPDDAIVVCSFGDASVNHSTAAGAFNAAAYCAYQGLPLPVLLVCEDNGLGISVRTPPGWVAAAQSGRPGVGYFHADGSDLAGVYDTALAAASFVRERRAPAFLHLSVTRLGGHAGSDAEAAYRSAAEIAEAVARDPLTGTARLLIEAGAVSGGEVLAMQERSRDRVLALAAGVAGAPKLAIAARVIAPLAPRRPAVVAARAAVAADEAGRAAAFGGKLPEKAGPLTLAQAINAALCDAMAARPQMLVFGEDVARKGGVYGVTRGLLRRFGARRVFDSMLDEQSVLGLALGAGLAGLLPVPEIQYLAYLHNAADQIRGEAATLPFFSQGQFRNPMVVRIAGLAYQEGFGGHFHNDNAVAALRDIPGLIIAVPARAGDAAAMLRTCLAAAEADGSVCVFLEPIALYHTRDARSPGDGGWMEPYPAPGDWAAAHVPAGQARVYEAGDCAPLLTIVTFGNGLRLSLRAAARLGETGIGSRVVDLRWIAPLPVSDILREAAITGRVLVADETRRTGGVSEAVVTALADAGFAGRVARVASEDSFIPLGSAADAVLLSERAIEYAAHDLLRRR